jgi:hypothetical protein
LAVPVIELTVICCEELPLLISMILMADEEQATYGEKK